MLNKIKNVSTIQKHIIITGISAFIAFMISYSFVQEAVFSFWFDQLLSAFWMLSGITTIYSIIQFIKIGKEEF